MERNYIKSRPVTFAAIFIILSIIFTLQTAICQTQRIEKGDILEIRVYGHEELSKTVMVQPDGTVDYPMISNIPVEGLSLDELREILKAQATRYLNERPIISVRFSQTMNVGVTVLGQVVVPGEYLSAKRATIQGAITLAGGTTPRAQLENIKLIRKVGETTETISVNLYKFYVEGDPSLLPLLEDGDVIVVPGMPGSSDVKVIGEVKEPGNYQIFSGSNVLDALYMAGGPTEKAGLNRIRLISPMKEQSREIKVNVESLLKAQSIDNIPDVKPGDIIYVPTKRTFFKGLMAVLRDAATVLFPITMILYYAGVFER